MQKHMNLKNIHRENVIESLETAHKPVIYGFCRVIKWLARLLTNNVNHFDG